MTKNQIKALRWALEALPVSEHTPELKALLAQGTKAFNDRSIPLKEDHCKVPDELLRFMEKHKITIPNSELSAWRWLLSQDQHFGQINGIPESRGRVRCTNGILCYVERSDQPPFLGHFDFFVADEPVKVTHSGRAKSAQADASESAFAKYFTQAQ